MVLFLEGRKLTLINSALTEIGIFWWILYTEANNAGFGLINRSGDNKTESDCSVLIIAV